MTVGKGRKPVTLADRVNTTIRGRNECCVRAPIIPGRSVDKNSRLGGGPLVKTLPRRVKIEWLPLKVVLGSAAAWPRRRLRLKTVFWKHVYGDWESVTRPLWIYGHVCILLATALVGYTVARGAYLLRLLLPFPIVYLYKRHEKAHMYTVHSETPIE